MKYVLVDIDHTLSAAHWRDLLIPMNEEQKTLGFWDEYHSKSEWDELLPDVADVIRALSAASWYPIAITARPEKWRELTHNWINRYNLPIYEILMRPNEKCGHPTVDVKLQLFEERFPAPRTDQFLIIEDRADVAKAFHELGYTVLQVHAR